MESLVSITLQHFALAWGVCLACSALGFRRVVYFVSVSYVLSMGAQVVLFITMFAGTLRGWALAQSVLLLTYALRLGIFLLLRSRSVGFQKELAHERELGRDSPIWVKGAIWISVSLLYVLLFLPIMLTMGAQADGLAIWSIPTGTTVMATGLLVEAAADWQKSQYKLRHPARFCDVALYRYVRCPNYLGEVIFWFGVWFSAIAGYQTAVEWMLSTVGCLCIAGVMLDATRRLELKQEKEYGTDPTYRNYASTVPVLFPLVPLYSLRSPVVRPK